VVFPFLRIILGKFFLTNSLLSLRHTLNHFGPGRILKSLTFLLTFCILILRRGTAFFPVRFPSLFFRLQFIVKRIAITTRANRTAGNLFDGTSVSQCVCGRLGICVSVGVAALRRACLSPFMLLSKCVCVCVCAFWPGGFCRFWLRQKCRKFVQVTCLITFFQTFFPAIFLRSISAIDGCSIRLRFA